MCFLLYSRKNSSPEPESADSVHNDQDDDEDDNIDIEPPSATLTSTIGMHITL